MLIAWKPGMNFDYLYFPHIPFGRNDFWIFQIYLQLYKYMRNNAFIELPWKELEFINEILYDTANCTTPQTVCWNSNVPQKL